MLSDMSSLTSLELSFNNIKSIRENELNGLHKIVNLSCEQNQVYDLFYMD
jgi:Leucine-rich repeat (LRR) protein